MELSMKRFDGKLYSIKDPAQQKAMRHNLAELNKHYKDSIEAFIKQIEKDLENHTYRTDKGEKLARVTKLRWDMRKSMHAIRSGISDINRIIGG